MSANETKNHMKIIKGAGIGAVISLVVILLASLAVSELLQNSEMTETVIKTAASAVIFIGAAVGGFAAQKISRGGAAIIGILTAVIIIVLMLVVSVIFFDGPIIDGAGINALCVGAGAFSGALFSTFAVLRRRHVRH